MKKLLREPLVHFLLLGAGLFVTFGLVGERTGSEPGEIVATQGQIESLAIGFDLATSAHGQGAGGFDPGLYSRGSLLPRGDGTRVGQGRHRHPPESLPLLNNRSEISKLRFCSAAFSWAICRRASRVRMEQ